MWTGAWDRCVKSIQCSLTNPNHLRSINTRALTLKEIFISQVPKYISWLFLFLYKLWAHVKRFRAYHKDKYKGPHQSPRSNFARRSHDYSFINKMECFNCHNIGHTTRDCNLTWVPTQARTMTTKPEKKVTQLWRRKQIGSESLLNTQANNTCC